MRLFSIYPFFMILLSLFLFACDVHEWPDETPEPPKPGHVSVELRLDFTSDRAELPDYKTIVVGATRAADLPSYETRYQVRVFRMGADSLFETVPCQTLSFSHAEIESLGYRMTLDLPEGDYRFMAWADFVEPGGKSDLFYDTEDFASIKLRGEHVGNNDFRDAFRGVLETGLYTSTDGGRQKLTVSMCRPLAKFRFVTTDVEEFKEYYLRSILQNAIPGKDELKDAIDMTKFRIVFLYDGFMPSTYNMHTDRPVDVRTGVSFPSVLTDIKDGEAIMGFDYVIVGEGDAGVSVTVACHDENGKRLSGIDGIKVPLQRGRLTTVRGNFLTTRSSGNVQIDSSFDGKFDIEIK